MLAPAVPLFPGVPGGTELAVILLIAILLFGANKIPKLARSTGEAMGEFKKGREQVEQELEQIRDGTVPEETPPPSPGTESADGPVEESDTASTADAGEEREAAER